MSNKNQIHNHPCLNCGACCAQFRVSFYWREAAERNIPEYMLLDLSQTYVCMKGTHLSDPRCVALQGNVGSSNVKCQIYDKRPSVCRNFVASYENGEKNDMCDSARINKGLKPLTPEDWR